MDRPSLISVGQQTYDRIRATAKANRQDVQFALQKFALERLLVRIEESEHAGNYALKGGMLMLTVPGGMSRPTEDMDLTAVDEVDIDSFRAVLQRICEAVPAQEDGLTYVLNEAKLHTMRVESINPTIRATLAAELHNKQRGAHIKVRLDVSHGDHVYPGFTTARLPPTCKGFEPPLIPCYPWETVVAEKLHAIHQHGFANTRMRDYYDLISISRNLAVSDEGIAEAVYAAFTARGRTIEVLPIGLTEEFASMRQPEWKALVVNLKLVGAPASLSEAVSIVREFATPALTRAVDMAQSSPGFR